MRYRIGNRLVASENAAKPSSQASSYLTSLLASLNGIRKALDYGCGKLRYAAQLNEVSEMLTLVDSEIQLSRVQLLDGERTTVRAAAVSKWPRVNIETITVFQERSRPMFDFVLCANVLSAIPSLEVRNSCLAAIRRRLKRNGELLVVNQHTNSFFTQLAQRKEAVRHLDGWMILREKSASYYGVLDKERTSEILEGARFKINKHWIHGQSNYAIARRS